MPPSVLNPLFASVTTLPSLGPRPEQLFAKLLGPHGVSGVRATAARRCTRLVYPLPEGLVRGRMYRAVAAALKKLPPLPEWQDEAWLAQQQWPSFADALRRLHRPTEPTEVVPETA